MTGGSERQLLQVYALNSRFQIAIDGSGSAMVSITMSLDPQGNLLVGRV